MTHVKQMDMNRGAAYWKRGRPAQCRTLRLLKLPLETEAFSHSRAAKPGTSAYRFILNVPIPVIGKSCGRDARAPSEKTVSIFAGPIVHIGAV
jgi:hypothetical protein